MNRLATIASHCLLRTSNAAFRQVRCQSAAKKIMAIKEDKSWVEPDARKLCEHVCINYLIEGEDPGPKIQPDSEYPDWLFKMNLRDPVPLEEMTPETHGWLYWRALQNRYNAQMRRVRELKLKKIHLQSNPKIHRMKVYHK